MAPNADMNDLAVRRKVMRMCLHCSDVSNPTKRFNIYERWANLVMEEFYEQGDKERELGLPISPFYDRNKKQMAKCQIGFIQFIVRPLYAAFTELCISLKDEIMTNINENQDTWEKRKLDPGYLPPYLEEPRNAPRKALELLGVKETPTYNEELDDENIDQHGEEKDTITIQIKGKEIKENEIRTFVPSIIEGEEEEEEEEEEEGKDRREEQ